MPEKNTDSYTSPPIHDKRIIPPGMLPKNLQAWVLGGLAAIMIAVIALSGTTPTKTPRPAGNPATSIVNPNAARIAEYQKRIEEQTQKLQLEQSQLYPTREVDEMLIGNTARSTSDSRALYQDRWRDEALDRDSAILAEQEKREYQSLFASNVALSFRPESSKERGIQPSPANDELAKILSLNAALTALQTSGRPTVNPSIPSEPTASGAANVASKQNESSFFDGPSRNVDSPSTKKLPLQGMANDPSGLYRLYEGTVLETALRTRLDGSFSGPVHCMVTTNLYSNDGRHLLIPQGTRVLGEVQKVNSFGQERLAVFFHRLIMPDGYSVNLDAFQGLNQIGETGLRDQVNHHYLQVFGVSLAIGAIAGLGQANTRTGFDQSGLDTYEQGVTTSLSQSSLRILDRYLNVLPKITIREGHRVKVHLSQDLLLPAYDKHQTNPF